MHVKIIELFQNTSEPSAQAVVSDVIRFSCAGVQPVPLQTITNENPAGPSLGTVPQARFLLAMLHMLTLKHGANSLSLLLNSGTLALTQSVLRLIGQFNLHFSLLFGSKTQQQRVTNAGTFSGTHQGNEREL